MSWVVLACGACYAVRRDGVLVGYVLRLPDRLWVAWEVEEWGLRVGGRWRGYWPDAIAGVMALA